MVSALYRIIKIALSALRQPVVAIAVLNVSAALVAFMKDIWLAAFAGTSLHADALILAFFLPDSIGNNMLAAAISVVCVPVFSGLAARKQFSRLRLSVGRVSVRFLLVSVLLMIAAYGFSDSVIEWLKDASGLELARATRPLLLLLLPTIVLFVFIALGTAVLQTLQRFMAPAAGPLLFNLIFLGGVALCSAAGISVKTGISVVAVIITLGTLLTAIWIGSAWRKSMSSLPTLPESSPLAKEEDWKRDWLDIVRMFFPYMVVLFSMQAVYLAERYMMSALDTGAAAALNYAFRVSQFPVWVFVAAVSVILLPSLSKSMALERQDEARQVMVHAFRIVILIVLPIMSFMYMLREPMTSALFQRGAFDDRSLRLTSSILEGYSLSILSQSVALICLRYFLAIRRMTFVLIIFAASGAATILLDVWLLRWMGPKGIGFGAAAGALINATLLLYHYWRNARPGMQEISADWRLYRNLLPALLLLPAFRLIWSRITDHGTINAVIFISFSGIVFLTVYIFSLRRYWPAFIKTTTAIMGRG